MATFSVCSRCGNVQETDALDQLPKNWRRTIADLYCPRCANKESKERKGSSDVLDEEVIYPAGKDVGLEDTLDEDFCEICAGPCQGH